MAEKPAGPAKPAGAPKPSKPKEESKPVITGFWPVFYEMIFVVIILLALLRYLNGRWGDYSLDNLWRLLSKGGLEKLWEDARFMYTLLATLFSIGLGFIVVSLIFKVRKAEAAWKAMYYPSAADIAGANAKAPKNTRWERVVAHLNSNSPSDWRLAILECDIMLDELLNKEGYLGDTIGDKLKIAKRGDFETLDYAWEAHKIRNAIAHEGQDFELSDRESKRIVGLYERVFREFDFI